MPERQKEQGRQRQSILPDFLFQLDHPLAGDPGGSRATGGRNPAAGKVAMLGELKTSIFCPSYVFPGARKQGVEIRSDKIPASYIKKARDTDRDFCGSEPGNMGPVETKLRQYPDILKLTIALAQWQSVPKTSTSIFSSLQRARQGIKPAPLGGRALRSSSPLRSPI